MHSCVLLAKEAVERYVKKGEVIEPSESLPKDLLEKRAGVFVTIQKKEALRGCIGTYLPTKINIAEEIICNAVAAAKEDNRFEPVKKEELPYLSYVVYILGSLEPVENTDALDPKNFGIIVKTGPLAFPNQKNIVVDSALPYKTGLLLPDLKEVDTAEQQISIACQKGNIDPETEKLFIYKFAVEKYE